MLRRIVGGVLDLVLTRRQQARVGRFIQNRARGQNNADPTTNGEFWLLRRVASASPLRPVTLIDAGANLGEWSITALALRPDARVFAFEPNPDAYISMCVAAAKANRDVIAINAGLGEAPGRAALVRYGRTSGTNSLYARESLAFEMDRLDVEIMAGDKFCVSYGVAAIDLLKIDTEGHELFVLRGFAEMLKRRAIGCVQFEYGGAWLDSHTTLAAAYQLLSENGYSIGRLMPSAVEFAPYMQTADDFIYANFVAATPEYRSLIEASLR